MFSCGQKACSGVFADQLSLELIKRCGYVKKQAPVRCGGIDFLCQNPEFNVPCMHCLYGLDHLF